MSQRNEPPQKAPAEVMRELRTKMLKASPADLGIGPTESFPRVYGVLMDWPLGDQTATVVSLCDGNASLYTTSTFGVIGGFGHASVRAAAARCVKAGERHHDDATPTKDYPYPKCGCVRFYLVCFDGVRMIEADETALRGGEDKCSDMWVEGQQVLTELRLAAEKGQ